MGGKIKMQKKNSSVEVSCCFFVVKNEDEISLISIYFINA